jgi:CRISPR-associated protein Csb1
MSPKTSNVAARNVSLHRNLQVRIVERGGNMNKQFQDIAILTVKQKLQPAFPDDHIKPPTFAGNDGGAQYVTYHNNGRRDVIIDTHQSQANRIEPIFDGTGLIPDSTVRMGEQTVPLTALGHRVADAALRFSDAEGVITTALDAYLAGDGEPLAKLAPTSLLFGAWDSRGNPNAKVARAVRAEIRATDVSEPISVRGQYRASVERPLEGKNDELSAEGLLDCPTSGLGGVIVNGEIVRTVQLNVRAIRKLHGEGLQNYVLGLGLVALLAPADLDLREGCNVVVESTTMEAVNEDGTRAPFNMNYPQALEFAKQAAKVFGVGANRQFTYSEAKVKAKLDIKKNKGKKAIEMGAA